MSGELSVAQLQRMLESKQTMLTQLMRKRERLHRDLQQVEEKILSVGGGAAVRKGNKGRKRPKNDKTLLEAVIEVLGETKKGMGLGEIAEKVIAGGYKTGALKFENTVYQCLYNNTDKIHHDLSSRTYKLK